MSFTSFYLAPLWRVICSIMRFQSSCSSICHFVLKIIFFLWGKYCFKVVFFCLQMFLESYKCSYHKPHSNFDTFPQWLPTLKAKSTSFLHPVSSERSPAVPVLILVLSVALSLFHFFILTSSDNVLFSFIATLGSNRVVKWSFSAPVCCRTITAPRTHILNVNVS